MKKFIAIFFVFLFLSFAMNTISTIAQTKTFSQGFYTMEDFNLYEGSNHTAKNTAQYGEGLLIVLDNHGIIQQVIRVKPGTQYTLVPLLSGYQFIVYGNLQLTFA